MPGTVFTPALEGLKLVRDKNGKILTKRFSEICKDILPLLDKFEGAMALAKEDIDGNISRLESTYKSNPTEFNHLYKMVKSSSCADSLLWLTRYITQLSSASFYSLLFHPVKALHFICHDLPLFIRIISREVMKHAPDRKKFMDIIGGDVKGDVEKFCNTFTAILKESHNFLASIEKDNLKAQ
ncbi:hypothetical protein UlMin_038080 [Ulmus minor]